ncbi:MAG: hypothetical protein ACMXYB_04525 [Candidatus Woesearchaeota archaeon]
MVTEVVDFDIIEEVTTQINSDASSKKINNVEEFVEIKEEITEIKSPTKNISSDSNSGKEYSSQNIGMIQKQDIIKRPDSVEAKVYRLKSKFVKERLYITLSYVQTEDGENRPIEMFINSKDLSKLPEYTVLTRLISTIFRTFKDPKFILEELKSIYDPNGGYFSKGRYIYSFYSEIALIIERFFIDIGFMADQESKLDNWIDNAKKMNPDKKIIENNFKICPQCNEKSLQIDGGCLICINPDCGYSKCS